MNKACTAGAENVSAVTPFAKPGIANAMGWTFGPGTWMLESNSGAPEPSGVVLAAAGLALVVWRRV